MSENENNRQEILTSATLRTPTTPTQIPQIPEEKTEEVKYLLDNNQFLKFGHLLGEKKNDKFIKKIIDTPLIHSKRFFPISNDDYQIIKEHIEKLLEEKKKKANVEMNAIDNISTPTSGITPLLLPTTSTLSPISTTSTTTTTTSTTTIPTTSTTTSSSPPLPVALSSTSSSIATPNNPSLNIVRDQHKIKSKFVVWQPTVWEVYKPATKKS